jgi:hypothetical protein
MVEIPLLWKLQIQGAEEIKTKFNEINESFARGEIGASKYAAELRGVNRDSRALVNTMNMQKNIYLASHPVLLNLSRATSMMASVARTALSINNALNLSRIAGNSISSEEAQNLIRISELERDLSALVGDSIEIQQRRKSIEEDIRVLRERNATIAKEEAAQSITDAINYAASLALIVNQMVQLIPKMAVFVKNLGGIKDTLLAISFLQFPLLATLGIVGLFAGVFLAAYFGAMALFEALGLTKLSMADISYWYWTYLEPTLWDMWNFFTKTIPEAIMGFLGIITGTFQPIFLAVWQSIQNALLSIWASLQAAWDTLWAAFRTISDNVIVWLRSAWDSMWGWIETTAGSFMERIGQKVISFVQNIIGYIQSAINWFQQLLSMQSGGTSFGGGNPYAGMEGAAVINALHSAHGFEGTVTSPTLFMVGEQGPETVSVLPHTTRSSGGGTGGTTIIVHGSILSQRELEGIVDRYLKRQLKSIGFT